MQQTDAPRVNNFLAFCKETFASVKKLYTRYLKQKNEKKKHSIALQRGIFPSNWKTGEVAPVFKKGIKSDCANYRPLTMLNLNSKILEGVVCDSLDHHLGTNELIHPNQWGFKKGVSTESLLLYLTETWKKAIDDGYKVGVLFVDFKKAFDTVDHAILKTKLSDVGVSGIFHEWIASYLHERSQYVTVNGARSMLRQIDIGVPQGSLMGPRLFAIYVNDLPTSSETGSSRRIPGHIREFNWLEPHLGNEMVFKTWQN